MLLAGILWARPAVGDGVFGEAAGGRAHHAIARLEVLHVAADRLDLAGAFQADDRAGAAHRAVAMAGGDREVGAVERRRPHLDQDLVRLGHGLGDVAELDALLADDGCFHSSSVGRHCLHASAICAISASALPSGVNSAVAEGRGVSAVPAISASELPIRTCGPPWTDAPESCRDQFPVFAVFPAALPVRCRATPLSRLASSRSGRRAPRQPRDAGMRASRRNASMLADKRGRTTDTAADDPC